MVTLLPRGTIGLYEQPISAGVPWTVQIESTYRFASEMIAVGNVTAGILYFRTGPTCALRDPQATQVGANTWADVPIGYGTDQITIVSTTDTTVSVYRR